MQTPRPRLKLAASVVVALLPVLGCATKAKKSAGKAETVSQSCVSCHTAWTVGSPAPGECTRAQLSTRGQSDGLPGPKAVDEEQGTGKGIVAIKRAAKAGKYLFAFFRRDDDEQTRKMAQALDAAMTKVDGRAEQVTIDVSDPSERHIVKKFGVDRAPMPLVLVLAPNGAVTGGFPVRSEEKQLTEALVGPNTAKVLKALQGGKLVFVCVQNAQTKSNAPAMRGVKDFVADAEYAKSTEVVTFDPTVAAEAKFLGQIKIGPKIKQATTVLLAPPGTIVGKFEGATDKGKLVAALEACGVDCGPSGQSTGKT